MKSLLARKSLPARIAAALALAALGCAHVGRAADPAPPALDSIEQRVKPCTTCHGNEGRATREGYYPRIAGKPAGYLFNQLLNFRAGRRNYPMMTYLADHQDESYLHEIAEYFGAQRVPYPKPQPPRASAAVFERGRLLVMEGDAGRRIPSCRSCHGAQLAGVAPAVPGLLGVSQDYLTAQLGAWRIGTRAAAAPDCMAEVVHRMRPEDMDAAAAWLASQAVPDDAEAAQSFERPPSLDCGSIPHEGQHP